MSPQFDFLTHNGDAAFIIDKNQRITAWNSAAEEILGYTAAEARGRRCWMLLQGCTIKGQPVCQCDGPIVSQARNRVLTRHFHLLVKRQDGQRALIDISTIPLYNEKSGEPEGLAHLFRLVEEMPELQSILRIYLLGPVQVKLPTGGMVGGPNWQRVKVRALLATFALRGHPVHRDQLLDLLWPDLDYEAALRNLNTTVYNLRRSLEPELATVADSQYVIYEGGQS